MAHAVDQLGSWQADDTTVGVVLDVLDQLRRNVPAGTGTRTAVLTLVAVAASAAECERAAQALHDTGTTHPARTLGIVTTPEPGPLSAAISLHGEHDGDRQYWSEDIELQVGGPITAHLHSLIEPLTLPDLPVVLWFVDNVPAVQDPLLEAADAVIVDARDLADAASFAAIRAMAARVPVIDLSWFRLRPWRELLAALFEGDARPFVHQIDTAEVRGKEGPRRLLAGWLADRLGLPPPAFRILPADHAYMRVAATVDGRRGEFTVSRRGDERTLVATAEIAPEPAHHSLRLLPPSGPAWGLQEALTSLHHDPVYLGALDAAATLAI